MPLHQVVAESVEELAAIYPARKLQHRKHGAGVTRADRNRVSQLLGNLVSNAITYGDPAAPVTVTSTIEPTGVFCVEVHNEGPTISESAREGLFLPMTRGADATNADRSVGLGLYIVREIAKAHGGTVAVESSSTEGTTFRVAFPASNPDEPPHPVDTR
jgi:sigma-B regulation protein RsbU (phosphoserine phosphatase)